MDLIAIFFVILNLLPIQQSFAYKTVESIKKSGEKELVWRFKQNVYKNSNIITDLSLYQALADYKNVYMYERLPTSITFNFDPIYNNENFFPNNINHLKYLSKKIDYILIGRNSINDLKKFLDLNNFLIIFEDKYFIAYKSIEKQND